MHKNFHKHKLKHIIQQLSQQNKDLQVMNSLLFQKIETLIKQIKLLQTEIENKQNMLHNKLDEEFEIVEMNISL